MKEITREQYKNELYCKTHILEKSENFTHMFIGVKNEAFILTNAVNNLENCR